MRVVRRLAPSRALRPSWHAMVNDPSMGAAMFGLTRYMRLIHAKVLGSFCTAPNSMHIKLACNAELIGRDLSCEVIL